MTESSRIRGVGILCCYCVTNVAYYYSGWADGALILKNNFWRTINGNFLDMSVLEWCKLFADGKGKHHWRKVVADPDAFLPNLYEGIGVTEEEFETHWQRTRIYRDKFVAHLDEERTMHLPTLAALVDSAVFLYDLVRNEQESILSEGPPSLREFYEERLQEAQEFYSEAVNEA